MRFDFKTTVLLSAVCLSMVAAEPVSSKDNIFKRGVSAVKDFFKDEKEKSDSTAVKDTEPAKPEKETKERQFASREAELQYLYDISLDENVRQPQLGKQKDAVRNYQQVQAKRLVAAGESVETMRGGEVIIATVPSENLFLPNDTVLKASAGKYLRPYLAFLKTRDMYRMLLAMHSDDTGSESYTDALTGRRVLAVLKWFQQNAVESDYVIPYAMGASEPLYENNSYEKRGKNRRLEIYLVPGRTMKKLASDGQLH